MLEITYTHLQYMLPKKIYTNKGEILCLIDLNPRMPHGEARSLERCLFVLKQVLDRIKVRTIKSKILDKIIQKYACTNHMHWG